MKAVIWIISTIVIIAIAAFVVFGYSSYFKVEQKNLDTDRHALEAAKQTKALLEARDKAMYQSVQSQ